MVPEPERLRLWLERAGSGYRVRDAATGELVRWEDERVLVVPVAGISYRAGEAADPSFDPGRRLAYVPRDVAPTLRGEEQAISLWRVEGGLRVLIVPAGAWVGTPR